MRMLMLSGILALHLPASALGATLTATHAGVMCAAPEALAKLTLPDGSSRSSGANTRPDDLATKNSGGCIDIPPGAKVTVKSARKNTSVVTYDANDGQGARDFTVPNTDFTAAADAPGAAPTRHAPGWADADYPPLVDANKVFSAVHKQCPQQGWNEHLLSHTEVGPWSKVGDKLTPAQNAIIEREVAKQCDAGMSCPADITFGMEVRMGYLNELVRSICSEKAPPDW